MICQGIKIIIWQLPFEYVKITVDYVKPFMVLQS